MLNEFCPLAAAIEAGNDPLPPHVAKLIEHAPESFVDTRAGQIAVTIRAMRQTGEPVTFPSIGDKHLAHLTFISTVLSSSALPQIEAEYHAKKCWREYQARRAQSIFAEAHQSVLAAPDKVEAIVGDALTSLDSINGDKASGFTIRTPDEILDMVFSDDDIILGDRMMAEGQSCVIAAAGGMGKSRIVLQLIACIVTGRKFLNFDTGKPDSKWLVLQTENSNRRLHEDLKRLKCWLGDDDWRKFAAQVKFHTVETDTDGFMNLDSPEAVANIQTAILENAPDNIVIDPLNDCAIGDPSKDADMKATVQALSRVCRKGNPKRLILVLHHAITGKSGAAKATGFDRASFGRNSKALFAWTRAQFNIAPVDPDSNERLIVACGKCSNGREFPTFAVRLNLDSMIYVVDPSVDVSEWEKEVANSKATGATITSDRVRELCAVTGSKKAELVKAIVADCFCVRGSAYRFIKRAEKEKKITFNKSNETYFRK